MARKSLADRIRESGKTTQRELDRSKKLIDRIIQPASPLDAILPDLSASAEASSDESPVPFSSEAETASSSRPATDNITDIVSGKTKVSPTISPIRSVTKNAPGSVINYHSPDHSHSVSLTRSVTQLNEPFDPIFPEGEAGLSKRQKEIFQFLASVGDSAFIQATHISQVTGIPVPTVRKVLRDFRDKNILNYKRYQRGGKKGIVYSLNPEAKEEIAQASKKASVTISVIQPSVIESVISPINSSSSLYFNNKTTTEDTESIGTLLGTHPEMGYWRQKGLTEKQIAEWMKTTDCSLEQMATYLGYCRFEMVDLDMERSKPIHDVFNWFFKILERSGQYRKPRGYKSHLERKLEADREILAAKERRIEELKALQRQKWERERDLEFWEMMNDPDGERYRECFERLSNFDRKRARKGGKAFEMAMRRAYDQIADRDEAPNSEEGEGG